MNRWYSLSFKHKFFFSYSIGIFSLVIIAYLASFLDALPHAPDDMSLDHLMLAPLNSDHWLGTDYLGRDTLSRLMLGVQAYFFPGLLAVGIAIGAGSLLGALSIIAQRSIGTFINFTQHFLQTMPRLVLLLLIIAIFEPEIYLIMIIIGITAIPTVASHVSARVERLNQRGFIDFAKGSGTPLLSIIFKHLLWYNCRGLLISLSAIIMGEAILMETSLSYLGFGVQEPTPSWGNMVQAGANTLLQGDIWSSTLPALAIMLVLSALYLFSHTISQIFDHQ